jgi:hypothetical protein
MMPPPLAGNPNKPDLSAPLSKWMAHDQGDTFSVCEQKRKDEIFLVHNPYTLFQRYIDFEKSANPKDDVFNIEKMQDFSDGQKCIASGDPRLKGDHDPDLRDVGH